MGQSRPLSGEEKSGETSRVQDQGEVLEWVVNIIFRCGDL
jgi:hypothetical protein